LFARAWTDVAANRRAVNVADLLPLAARGAQRLDDASAVVEQEQVRRAARQLRDEEGSVTPASFVFRVQREAHDALPHVLRYSAHYRAARAPAEREQEL
jgi:hypothetical protein